jgi:hypothetical protein
MVSLLAASAASDVARFSSACAPAVARDRDGNASATVASGCATPANS